MRRLTFITLTLVVGAASAHAASPAEVMGASYKNAIAKQTDRAKRDELIRSLPHGCEIGTVARKPAEPAARPRPQPAPAARPVPAAPAPVRVAPPPPVQEPAPQPSPSPATVLTDGVTIEQALANGAKAHQARKYADAMKWYSMAAAAGDPSAETAIGDLYFNGHGVPVDYGQAMAWYRKAAAKGNATAEEGIGSLYERGQGVRQDHVEATKWFRRAAAKGNADAMNWLGYLYTHGLGVTADLAQAQSWFAKARAARPAH